MYNIEKGQNKVKVTFSKEKRRNGHADPCGQTEPKTS